MFGDNSHSHLASSLSVDILRDDIKRQRENILEMYRLQEELRKKVNGLYEKDIHDTERPKVDMLDDVLDRHSDNIYQFVNELQGRIKKLEEKK